MWQDGISYNQCFGAGSVFYRFQVFFVPAPALAKLKRLFPLLNFFFNNTPPSSLAKNSFIFKYCFKIWLQCWNEGSIQNLFFIQVKAGTSNLLRPKSPGSVSATMIIINSFLGQYQLHRTICSQANSGTDISRRLQLCWSWEYSYICYYNFRTWSKSRFSDPVFYVRIGLFFWVRIGAKSGSGKSVCCSADHVLLYFVDKQWKASSQILYVPVQYLPTN